jgi:DNA-binding SARP family transcriptional activator/tetratricopeptide (TPR) repeat protein
LVLDLGGSVLVEFGVLGPLQVNGGVVLSAKQRILLAVLLLHASRVVPVETLIDALWDDAPPSSARVTLQGYVKQLRQNMGEQAGKRLVTRSPGYLMVVAADELDLDRFTGLCDQAQSAVDRGDWPEASRLFGEALSLWRGDPLADVPAPVVQRTEVPRLAELRVRAVESRVDADLRLGRHRELVAELRGLVGCEPLREALHGHLMLALYRCGRQAEALEVFRSIDQRLRGELGISPGPELQNLHQRILTADPSLTDGQVSRSVGAIQSGGAGVVPRQLPAAVRHFTGRTDELRALIAVLDELSVTAGTVVVTALGGMGGIGKTALAVYWAHQVASAFPDGQLYVDLRGFGPDTGPLTTGEAVRGFLDAFEVPPSRIPLSVEAQCALYRSLAAGKRMLVVLDNARDAAQVRPLLPGTASCMVLVTSRHRLTSLVAAEGARVLDVDVLSRDDARELLARQLGAQLAVAESAAVDELIELCSGLPLALSIAAALVSGGPGRFAAVTEELRQERRRLDALSAGDPVTDVRAVFSWSCQCLSDAAMRMFRLLGLHPGRDVSLAAVASLAGYPLAEADRVLAELTQAHLVAASSPNRYRRHDLLMVYAAEQAEYLAGAERDAALRRMMDYYLHAGLAADRRLSPRRHQIAVGAAAPGTVAESPADTAQAQAWFEREIPELLAVGKRATALGFDTHAWQIPWAAEHYLRRSGRWLELIPVHVAALAAARRAGHHEGQADLHAGLGVTYSRLGAFVEGQDQLVSALDVYGAIGNLNGQANAHLKLAQAWEAQGRPRDALHHALTSLELVRRSGDLSYEADALCSAGWYHALCGEFIQALALCEESLRWYRSLRDPHGEAAVLDTLGYCHHHLGRSDLAIACYQQALERFQAEGDRHGAAVTLTYLGELHKTTGAVEAARGAWEQALAILGELSHPDAEKLATKIKELGRL